MSKQILINMKESVFKFDRCDAIDKIINRDKEQMKKNIETLLNKPYIKGKCKRFFEYLLEKDGWKKVLFQDSSVVFVLEFDISPLLDSVLMIVAEYSNFDDEEYRERLLDIILDDDEYDEKMYELLDELEVIPIRINSNSRYRVEEMRNILSKIPVIDYIDFDEETYLHEIKNIQKI